MKAIFSLLMLALVSCTSYDYMAQSKSGNLVTVKARKLGGTISTRASDGSSMVSDDQRSFGDATGAIALGLGAWGNVKNTASNNSLSASKAAQQTAQKANAIPPTIVEPIITPTGQVVFPQVIPPKTIVPKP